MTPARPKAVSTLLQETERVIVTEWRFAAGAETAEGNVETTLRAGQAYARPAGVEHNIVNASPGEFAFVEIELK